MDPRKRGLSLLGDSVPLPSLKPSRQGAMSFLFRGRSWEGTRVLSGSYEPAKKRNVRVNDRSKGSAPVTLQALTRLSQKNKGPAPFGGEPFSFRRATLSPLVHNVSVAPATVIALRGTAPMAKTSLFKRSNVCAIPVNA
jgi:hypothetical protein